jgi:predicted ArsR family transcriptional regulator
MWTNRWNQRFFNSTRGRILTLLRGTGRTIRELAITLNLTDNAVRTQLALLEREGLVEQSGTRRGFRKPHYTYTLTPIAEQVFPKAYDTLLNQVLEVMEKRFSHMEMEEMLREIGQTLARQVSAKPADNLEERVQAAVRILGDLGGLAEVERQNGQFVIRGANCPFTTVVVAHPQVCRIVETFVAALTQTSVQEHCNRQEQPQCYFTLPEAAR